MRTALLASGALFGALAIPAAAAAQNAYATADVNMRAGPGTRYPVVTTVPENRAVTLHGCIQGYDWCDVSWRGNRGWVFGDYVEYIYQGQRVIVGDYGPRIDLPIISFSFGSYWDRHYSGRPWYDDRERWRDGRRGDGRDRDRGDWDNGEWNGDRDRRDGDDDGQRWRGDNDDADQRRSDGGNEERWRQDGENRDGRDQSTRFSGDDQRSGSRGGGEEQMQRGEGRGPEGERPRGRGPDWCEGENCPPFGNGRN